jgi:hypothetical protein
MFRRHGPPPDHRSRVRRDPAPVTRSAEDPHARRCASDTSGTEDLVPISVSSSASSASSVRSAASARVTGGEHSAPTRPATLSPEALDRFESARASAFVGYNPMMASLAFWQAAMNPMQFWMNAAIASQIALRGPFAPISMGPFY